MPLDPTTGLQTIPQDPSGPQNGTTASSVQQRLDALTKNLDALQAAASAPPDSEGNISEATFLARQQLPGLLKQWRETQALLDNENKSPTTPKLQIFTESDGSTWYLDAKGNKVQLSGPKVVDKPFTIPDPVTGLPTAATSQEYVAYANAKNKADANQNTQDRNTNTASQAIADANLRASAANARTDLGYYQADLDAKYKAGLISETQAMDLFKQKYDEMTYAQKQREDAFANQDTMLQSGIAAGNQAMDAAQRGTVNAVGPTFGADYASSLSAASKGDVNGVHFGAGDFTTPMPNYAQLATQGAAAAIAHLSPYAASLVGQQGMPQYQGAGATAAPVQPGGQTVAPYVPPNFEATASQHPPIAPYQPPLGRAVGANAQIQSGLR